MKRKIGIIIGVLLIGCGLLYIALDIFGIDDIHVSLDGWWTLFIIIPCLCGLFTDHDKLGSIFGLSVGVLLLLAARGVFSYSVVWKAIVPLILVLAGIKLITYSVSSKKASPKPTQVNENENGVTAVFNEQSADYTGEEVTTAKVNAVFGGATCNLRNANVANNSKLELLCVFGGAEILVPEHVIVKNNVFCLFGGISDKRSVKPASEESVTVYVNGFCIFGGADIK